MKAAVDAAWDKHGDVEVFVTCRDNEEKILSVHAFVCPWGANKHTAYLEINCDSEDGPQD